MEQEDGHSDARFDDVRPVGAVVGESLAHGAVVVVYLDTLGPRTSTSTSGA